MDRRSSQFLQSDKSGDSENMTSMSIPSSQRSDRKEFMKNEHFARLGNYAELLWQHNLMTDVRLKVNEYTFNAHKAVLACYSPYLKKKFDRHPRTEVLNLTGIKANVLRILLDYMYTGELRLHCQSFPDLFLGAKRLKMREVLDICIEKLRSGTISSFFYMYVSATRLNLHEKCQKANSLLLENFEDCIRAEEFLTLTCDQICDLLSADTMAVRSEMVIFMAALKWLTQNRDNRENRNRDKYALRIFSCVRFPLMTQLEILHCFKPPIGKHLMVHPHVVRMLQQALCYATAKQNGLEKCFTEYSCKPRKYTLDGEISMLWDLNMTGENDEQHLNSEGKSFLTT